MSYFDMDPIYESDEVILREIERGKRLARKPRTKKTIAPAKVELLLDQDHQVRRGNIVNSHLIAVPHGEQPHWALKRLFDKSPFGQERVTWSIISDTSLTDQLPNHDVYWLCPSSQYTAEWVAKVVAAVYSEPPTPKREITKRVVVEF